MDDTLTLDDDCSGRSDDTSWPEHADARDDAGPYASDDAGPCSSEDSCVDDGSGDDAAGSCDDAAPRAGSDSGDGCAADGSPDDGSPGDGSSGHGSPADGSPADGSPGDDGPVPDPAAARTDAGEPPAPGEPLVRLDPAITAPAAPVPAIPAAPAVSPFAGIPGLGGDTAAVLGSVGAQLADAGVLAHTPLSASSDPGLADATARAATAGRAADALGPLVASQEIRNEVAASELAHSSAEAARRAEQEAWFAANLPSSTLGTFGG